MRRFLSLLLSTALLLAPLGAFAQNSPFPLTTGGTIQSAAAAVGNGTAMPTAQLAVGAFQVSGTFVATVIFEGTVDGTNYVALPACDGTTSGSTVSATGVWVCNVNGFGQVRARIASYSSGSVTVAFGGSSSNASILGVGGGAGASASMQFYSQTLNPTAMAALTTSAQTVTSVEQSFTVTGLVTGQTVFINGPAPTAFCPPGHVRVSAASTLTISFVQLTAAVCTPATGTYQIVSAPPLNFNRTGQVYIQTLNPAAMIALVGNLAVTSAEQSFTVTGLSTSTRVFVNGPAPTAFCPPTHWRVSAADTLRGSFLQLTAAVCTPATGTYQIVAL